MSGFVFALKRLAFAVVLLVVVSILVFSLQSLSTDGMIATILGGRPGTPEQIDAIRLEYRLDDPWTARYGDWLISALQGDLGSSIRSGQSVSGMIVDRLPLTLGLITFAIVIIVTAGVLMGMLAGIRRGTIADRLVTMLSLFGLSAPVFVTGIVLLYVFGVLLGWFPVYGAGTGAFGDRLRHLALPALALAVSLVAIIARQTRAVTLTVMEQDYITFARSRGLSPARILLRYALRNVALPLVTITGLIVIALVSGTVLVEQVFSIDGLGSLMVRSVQAVDVPVVQGIALVFAVLVVAVNLLVDLVGMWIDPRTMYTAKG
ncbi:ABC transporter permease [Microbacterium sp. NPDC058342]|uniref:ABC transporter permease n=1 Tax=Microbacterium sp. NPDC058342 TaxID=3346454 RepID=UPI0036625E01